LSVTGLKLIVVGKSVMLHLTAKLSASTILDLVLVNTRGRTLTRWVIHGQKGSHLLTLHLGTKAGAPGHDTLKITQTGTKSTKTFPVTLKV
jgi:hypothetical protein